MLIDSVVFVFVVVLGKSVNMSIKSEYLMFHPFVFTLYLVDMVVIKRVIMCLERRDKVSIGVLEFFKGCLVKKRVFIGLDDEVS
jgi:hypothetical protein